MYCIVCKTASQGLQPARVMNLTSTANAVTDHFAPPPTGVDSSKPGLLVREHDTAPPKSARRRKKSRCGCRLIARKGGRTYVRLMVLAAPPEMGYQGCRNGILALGRFKNVFCRSGALSSQKAGYTTYFQCCLSTRISEEGISPQTEKKGGGMVLRPRGIRHPSRYLRELSRRRASWVPHKLRASLCTEHGSLRSQRNILAAFNGNLQCYGE